MVLYLALGGSSRHNKDWTVTLDSGSSPSALRGTIVTLGEGGGVAPACKPCLSLRQGAPSGMVQTRLVIPLYGTWCLHKTWDSRHLLRAIFSREWCKMHSVLCAQESPHYGSQNHPQSALFGPWRIKRSHQRLDCNFGKWTLPIGSKGRRCNRRGGLTSAFKPRIRLQQAGLAARDPTCHPPLQGLVSPGASWTPGVVSDGSLWQPHALKNDAPHAKSTQMCSPRSLG